jgi:hypothetical protein
MYATQFAAAAIATVMTVALFAAASNLSNSAYSTAKADTNARTEVLVANAGTTVVVTAHRV